MACGLVDGDCAQVYSRSRMPDCSGLTGLKGLRGLKGLKGLRDMDRVEGRAEAVVQRKDRAEGPVFCEFRLLDYWPSVQRRR